MGRLSLPPRFSTGRFPPRFGSLVLLDNVTHSLTGLFLSRAGMNRLTPYATPILILSANAPDSDILVLATGKLNYFHFHRHLTHSLVCAPILAAIVVAIVVASVRLIAGKPFPLLPAFLVALAGVASHLLLDLTNAYGVRLLLPFSAEWFRWDITYVVDVWILSIFAFCLAAPFLSKLVGGEIGAPSSPRYPSRGFALFALASLVFYDGGRAVLHSRVLATLDAREYQHARALRVAAFPPGSNPFRWKALAESEDAYHSFDFDLAQTFDPASGQILRKTPASPAIDAALRSEPFQVMRAFDQYPLWQTQPASLPDGDTRVVLLDLRFPFFAEALVARSGSVVTSRFSF